MSIGQDGEDTKYKDQEKKLLEVFSYRTTGQCRTSNTWALSQPEGPADGSYSGRTSDLDRTSDDSQALDDRPPPDDRASDHITKITDIR